MAYKSYPAAASGREFRGQFRVNRPAYGLGKASPVLADDVAVSLHVKAADGPPGP